MRFVDSFYDLYRVENLVREHYDGSEEGMRYRAKIYESVLGKKVEFGSVKDQEWKIFTEDEDVKACLFVSLRDARSKAYLCFLVVDPEFRNRGLGTLLLRDVMEYIALEYSPEKFTLSCLDSLKSFYENRGFKHVSSNKNLHYMETRCPCPVYIDFRNNPENIVQKSMSRFIALKQVDNWESARIIWKPTSRGFTKQDYQYLSSKKGLFNHFPNSHQLTSKHGLYDIMSRNFHPDILIKHFIPMTQRMSGEYPVDVFGNDYWIVKPDSKFGGQGIQIVKSREELTKLVTPDTIFQKYLENPFLTKDGLKFDLRAFVLITNSQVYVYRNCYVRKCMEKYDLGDVGNLKRHLTNTCYQMEGLAPEVYDQLHEDGKQYMPFLERWLCTIAGWMNGVVKKNGCSFELFGLDVILDMNMKPWLLEINTNCSLDMRTSVTKKFVPELLNSVFEVVLSNEVNRQKWLAP